jgi:hypothetical protein
MRRSLHLLLSIALVLGSASVALLTSSQAQRPETRSVTATYSHGIFRISIPNDAARIGEGILTVEILDPRIDRRAYTSLGRGVWRQDLVLPKTLPFEDLVWHRLRYRITYNGEQTSVVSHK